MARDMAMSSHDAMHGRKHTLQNPEVRRIAGICQRMDGVGYEEGPEPRGAEVREFRKGDVILRKGDDATTVCQVQSGFAFPERNVSHRYAPGDCFGAAALLARHRRMTSIIAGSDGTRVCFYDLVALRRTDPRRASRIFMQVMEDALAVISELERSIDRYRKHPARAAAV
jgi:CRP-like cAMP-binding protein